MNERILELAQQAGMYVDLKGKPWPKWMSAEECEVAYAKFAELIVRENINLLRQEWYDLNNAPKEENETPRDVGLRVGRKAEVVALINKISNHFGVE